MSVPVELVADGGVLVVEEAVGARAAGVDALLGLLGDNSIETFQPVLITFHERTTPKLPFHVKQMG